MIVTPGFVHHWKTQMLVDLTSDPAAPLFILRLWGHCQQQRSDRFHNLTACALRAICRADAIKPNRLVSILVKCGFIEIDGDLTIAHGWADANSSLLGSWENGRKGGRPPKAKPGENPRLREEYPLITGSKAGWKR